MKLIEIGVIGLFYVPAAATYVHPLLGFGVSTLMIVLHYRYQPFKRAIKNAPDSFLD